MWANVRKCDEKKFLLTQLAITGRIHFALGDVAQLGERSVRNAEAEGSNPFISTMVIGPGVFVLTSAGASGFL